MVLQTAFEFFSFVPFPVIITDSAGTVVYKNCHSARYLSKIRRGSKINRHLKNSSDDVFSGRINITEFSDVSPYFRAMIFIKNINGNDYFLFVFPSRIQFDDYREIASDYFIRFGSDSLSFFTEVLNASESESSDRLYGEILNFTQKYCDGWSFKPEICDVENILKPLFKRLCGAFRSLGIRLSGEIDESVKSNRYCLLRPIDFVFYLCRIVYVTAKCSSNKAIAINALYLSESNEISIEIKTKSDVIIKKGDICELAPECVFESELFSKTSSLKNHIVFENDNKGCVTASYKIPCVNGFMSLALKNTYGGISINKNIINYNVSEVSSMLKKR